MVFWHVLWPCAGCLQRTRSGSMPGACFPVYFVADCGKIRAILFSNWGGGSTSGQLFLMNRREKMKFEASVTQLKFGPAAVIFWSLVLWFITNSEEGLLWEDVLCLWESLRRKCNVTPVYCLYPRFLLSPDWNNLKLFHCWIPLAVTQDSCHAVGYVNCMSNNPSRNTITVPFLDSTSEGVFQNNLR